MAWSQQASVQGAQQADQSQGVYGRSSTGVASVPASGGSANAASQYGGQYGAVYAAPTHGTSQQVRADYCLIFPGSNATTLKCCIFGLFCA